MPNTVYEGVVSMLRVGVAILLTWKRIKKGFRDSVSLAYIGYVVLFFCSTLICRRTIEERKYNFHSFWRGNRLELKIASFFVLLMPRKVNFYLME